MTEPLEATDPFTIGPYRLLARLGAGGMGVVYLVQDADGTRYALKALAAGHRMDAQLRARLAREAASLTGLDSPHVVSVVSADTTAEVPYLLMRYAEGVGLDRAVPPAGFASAEVLAYGSQLAGALEYVHARGIVHRDVKPQNVLLGPSGVTLVDFGIASLGTEATTALTRQGTFLGSLAWLAPEIIQGGTADRAADVFGLGLVLGFLALGRNPFGSGRPEAVMYRIMHGEPDLQECAAELVPIIEAALVKDPAARASAQQIRELLDLRLEQPKQQGATPGTPPGAVTTFDQLRVGQCVRDPLSDTPEVVPCSEPHMGEVVLVDAAFYAADTAPPEITIGDKTDDASVEAVEWYTAQPIIDGPYWYEAWVPSVQTWALGDRSLIVFATTLDASGDPTTTTGSIAARR